MLLLQYSTCCYSILLAVTVFYLLLQYSTYCKYYKFTQPQDYTASDKNLGVGKAGDEAKNLGVGTRLLLPTFLLKVTLFDKDLMLAEATLIVGTEVTNLKRLPCLTKT